MSEDKTFLGLLAVFGTQFCVLVGQLLFLSFKPILSYSNLGMRLCKLHFFFLPPTFFFQCKVFEKDWGLGSRRRYLLILCQCHSSSGTSPWQWLECPFLHHPWNQPYLAFSDMPTLLSLNGSVSQIHLYMS